VEPHQKLFQNWTVLCLLDPLSVFTDALRGLWWVGEAGFLSVEATLPYSQQTMFIPVYDDFIFLDPAAISKDGGKLPSLQFPGSLLKPFLWLGIMMAAWCLPCWVTLPILCSPRLRGEDERWSGTEWSFTQKWKPPPRETSVTLCFFSFKAHLLNF